MRGVSVLFVVVVGALAGCRERELTREQLEDRYVDEVVEGGIDRDIAECVISRLFGGMTDAELREFNTSGADLTAEERQRVGQLADACGATGA